MARSNKIYLVWIKQEDAPNAAFTVKREAINYIKRTFSSIKDIDLFVMPDGRSGFNWIELEDEMRKHEA